MAWIIIGKGGPAGIVNVLTNASTKAHIRLNTEADAKAFIAKQKIPRDSVSLREEVIVTEIGDSWGIYNEAGQAVESDFDTEAEALDYASHNGMAVLYTFINQGECYGDVR